MDVVPAWGIELSSYALRAVKLELSKSGKPRITAWDIVDFAEEVEDLTDLSRHHVMSRALFHFKSRHHLRHSRVFVSVRAETAFNRTVVIPPVNDESLDRLLEYEAQQQIPFPLDEVFWDRRVLSIREDGEIHATLYAIRRALVEDRHRRLVKNRFPVDGFQLRPIALHNFCAMERHLEPGTVVICVDYGGIQILVYHDDYSWFRCLPIGGVDYISRIKETFNVDHRQATRMAAGEARIADKEKFLACREEAGRLVAEEAARVVNYYLAARPQVKPQGIVLFESHRCAPPLAQHLKKILGQPVIRPKGFRHIEVDPDVVTAGIQEHFPSLALATGLALQGIGKAEVEVRLYPQDMQRALYGGRVGYVAAAILVIALLTWVGLTRSWTAEKLSSEGEQLLSKVLKFKTLDEYRERFSTARQEAQLNELAKGGDGRIGRLPLVEKVWEILGGWPDAGRAPRLVSIAFGDGSGLDPDRASLVLAVDDSVEPKEAIASMNLVIDELKTAGLVMDVATGVPWVAGESVTEPPEVQPERPLRVRLRHVRYSLQLGEAP